MRDALSCVQVALNRTYVETLNGAVDVVSRTRNDQASLAEEVRTATIIRRFVNPVLFT